MSITNRKAVFWKCALQVNPATYINYRGINQKMTEEQYNQELLKISLEEGIKVLGIADHGNVDGVDAIRKLMTKNEIIVFPGFEIASSEKTHFVCLFPESTTKDSLNQYLGALKLTDPGNRIRPSSLSAEQLLEEVEKLGGVVFAAHCTNDSGILKQKLNHIWKNPLLKAAQIPGSLDGLGNESEFEYKKILQNKNADYKREKPIAIINAKDVEKPETLKNPKASCLFKMTKPCFASFKQAFLDPESRVRLNSDIPEFYYSRIEKVSFIGGYLDGIEIDFSEHLNAVIGGRGTGKSTLLECIRYGLEQRPTGKNAKKQHEDIVRANLGKENGRIEIIIRSATMNGRRFTISRKYGESPFVKDDEGSISSFTVADLIPRIEIFGQNEIHEIAQNSSGQLKLLNRFLEIDNSQLDHQLEEISGKLSKNSENITDMMEKLAEIEEEVARLPKLQERVGLFKEQGLEDKLKIIPLLEKEKQLSNRSLLETSQLFKSLSAVDEFLPDSIFLSDNAIKGLPHEKLLKQVKNLLDDLNQKLKPLLEQAKTLISNDESSIIEMVKQLLESIKTDEENLAKAFKEIPSFEGRSGREVGNQFKSLLQQIERIKPKEKLLSDRIRSLTEHKSKRQTYLAEQSKLRATRSAVVQRALNKLNKKLDKKLILTVEPEANRQSLVNFINDCNLEGVGQKRLQWILNADDFSPVRLAETIRQGSNELIKTNWSITPSVADALSRLSESQIMRIEEIKLDDIITIELNIAHEGAENYRSLNNLSTGQQCTAILHMLLIENLDPLIMDQPEDNLDNAFIADRIVAELRSAKLSRQFIFATHNANIPVFGDAEWIGVFETEENHAVLSPDSQGAIDLPTMQNKASNILEGGKTAFIQRKDKYGF